MSVADLTPIDPNKEERWEYSMPGIPDKCFYCGHMVNGSYQVFWMGVTSNVLLHRGCAEVLARHLIGDAREAYLCARNAGTS